MSESNTKKKNRRKVIIIILAIILALLLTSIIAYPASNNESKVSQSTNTPESTSKVLADDRQAIDGTYETMTREEILEDLQKKQQLVTDKISSNVTFPSGNIGANGKWVMENTKDNNVIQQAEIYYGDNLLIAKTEPVYPGQYIETVKLLENLKPGEHEALVYITYYNVDDKTMAGQAGYKIHLSIKS